MSRRLRAQHARFDRELDQLTSDGVANRPDSPATSELARTARYLCDGYAREQATPDEAFVRHLERRLMSRSESPGARPWIAPMPSGPHPRRRMASGQMPLPAYRALASAVASVLLIALVATTAFVALRGNSPEAPSPTTITGATLSETPEATRELVSLPDDTTWPLSVPAGESLGFGGMAATDSAVYRLLASASFVGVEAIDAASGRVNWRLATEWSGAGIQAGAAGVYFVSAQNDLVAIDPVSGADRWQVALDAPVVSTALQAHDLDEDTIYVWDQSSTMTALDAATGEVRWQSQTSDPGGPQATTAGHTAPEVRPAIGRGIVVMVAANGTLNAFDRGSGEVVWSLPGFDGINTRTTIEIDMLLVLSGPAPTGDLSPNLTATGVELATGTVRWEIGVAGPLLQPAGSEDTFFYLIGDRTTTAEGEPSALPRWVDYSDCCAHWASAEATSRDMGDPDEGGTYLFGIDTYTGEVIWSRSTRAGRFIGLKTTFPESGGLYAWTSDGHVIHPQRETGGILPMPVELGGGIVGFVPGGERHFATLADGTFVPIDRYGEPA